MTGAIRVQRDGPVGTLVFDHEARRNAITRDMWRAIPAAARELDADDAIRVIVLRGAGEQAFVAGADISEFGDVRTGDNAERYEHETEEAFGALEGLQKPVVALIHGFCIGGGAALALTADLRYAADDAVLAIPPARLGLGYGIDRIESLVNVVGLASAREILFTARRFTAAEAERMGWVHRVLPKPDLDAFVADTARRIADNAPLTLRSAKRVLRELARPAAERDQAAMQASVHACFASEDYAEGIRAFLEKRRPNFQGR
ncbi:MAG: enoyl-CoA hydratase, partial [Myxococcota bacterium]